MILLLCQFVNHLEVIRLPVYCPSQQEKDDPKLYANNVRKLMAHEVYYFSTCPTLYIIRIFHQLILLSFAVLAG